MPAPGRGVLTLDGSYGEGGGQVVRTALTLGLLTQQPFVVARIRHGRADPGLKPQHVAILRLLQEMTGSTCTGDYAGSERIEFQPGALRPGAWSFDVGTAGALSLVLQTLLPVAIATNGTTHLRLRGGTDVPFSPTMAWLQHAYLPYVAPLANIEVAVKRTGFYPVGGGEVEVRVDSTAPAGLGPLRAFVRERLGARRITQGRVVESGGLALHAGPRASADLGAQLLPAVAHLSGIATPRIETRSVEADCSGQSLTLWLRDDKGNSLASDRLVVHGETPANAAKLAAQSLAEDWRAGACVDRHMADHIVPWVALGAGAVRVPSMTQHLTTNAWVCNQFLGPWSVRADRNLVR